jgi:hypothetical protein
MTEIATIDGLHAAVMADVIAAIPTATSEVSTRGLPEHGSPPRVIWVPGDDEWGAPQKRPRAGYATGRSLATCVAGVDLHCWGATRNDTWTLVRAVVRALVTRLGGAESSARIRRGRWVAVTGAMTAGEAYVLSIAVALDVPALPDPPTSATPTSAAITATGAVAGDGYLDAGETG